jgi:3-oxoadipate enol-lactonase
MMARITPRYTNAEAVVNGTRLYYETAGTGPPVVLVSGGGTLDRRQWDDEFGALAKLYHVIRYDIRGIGRSARPTSEFSHHEDLIALLERLNIERAVVCGVSFGAVIAIDLALDHPDMVSRLVLAGAGVSSDKQASVESVRALSALAESEGLEHAIGVVTGLPWFVSAHNASARRRIGEIYLDNRDVFADEFPLVTLWQPTTPPAGERLDEIRMPTLIVVGANDNPAALTRADRIASSITGAQKVVIADCGHMVNMDAPAAFNRAVLTFLRSNVAGINALENRSDRTTSNGCAPRTSTETAGLKSCATGIASSTDGENRRQRHVCQGRAGGRDPLIVSEWKIAAEIRHHLHGSTADVPGSTGVLRAQQEVDGALIHPIAHRCGVALPQGV